MMIQYIVKSNEEIKHYGDPKKTVKKYGTFKILLDDEIMRKWQSAVDRQIPVYLSTCGNPPDNKIYTRVEGIYVGVLTFIICMSKQTWTRILISVSVSMS
uniref:Uncharacterized protein n=1 Tax=Meloidogyne enterolobii TaxID=390850 RepID=A0A6V7X729_MELEN|nr:unnamed protein product [Meloidogyne enterolobii]